MKMHPVQEQYMKIKNDLDKILESDADPTIVSPAIFAHALMLAKMRESKNVE